MTSTDLLDGFFMWIKKPMKFKALWYNNKVRDLPPEERDEIQKALTSTAPHLLPQWSAFIEEFPATRRRRSRYVNPRRTIELKTWRYKNGELIEESSREQRI